MRSNGERKGDRGRHARKPSDIPGRGWRDVALRVKDSISTDHVSIVAAGVAFYSFLAIFPGLAAVVALYGLFANPTAVQAHIDQLGGAIPASARQVLDEQLTRLVSAPAQSLGLGLLVSLALALWSASRGVDATLEAINIAYDEDEKRGFFKRTAMTLGLTLGALALVLMAVLLVIGVPVVLNLVGMGGAADTLVRWLRWPLLAAGMIGALAFLYRYGPSRESARWRWVTPGALVATGLWLIGSAALSWYVTSFGDYEATYGSMAAIVILLLWFLVSAYAIILGAEINAEVERQTVEDSTTGAPRPTGIRRAFAADTVGETP